MDLPSTLGVPRICWLSGRVFWVRPMTMGGIATLLQWLDDILPGRAERELPPALGDEASQAAMDGPTGQAILRWLALRDQGVSFAEALALEANTEEDRVKEQARLLEVLFHRRRTWKKSGLGGDISETWCGSGMATLAQEIGFAELRSLTLDQFEWLASGGECDADRSPEAKGFAQAMAIYNAAVERQKANGDEPLPSKPEEAIVLPDGWRIKGE